MIRYTDKESHTLWAASVQPVLGARIHTLYKAFGNSYPFFKSWTAFDRTMRISAVFAIQGRFAYLVLGDNADIEELFMFIKSYDYQSLEVNVPQNEYIEPLLGKSGEYTNVMMCHNPVPYTPNSSMDIQKGTGTEVYKVLRLCFDRFEERNPFNSWVYDVHKRLVSGGAEIFMLRAEGKIVATGGYYCIGDYSAVIASVATHPKYRRKGYGEQVVKFLCKHIKNMDKTPYLLAGDTALVRYYRKFGFISSQPTVIYKALEGK